MLLELGRWPVFSDTSEVTLSPAWVRKRIDKLAFSAMEQTLKRKKSAAPNVQSWCSSCLWATATDVARYPLLSRCRNK